LGIFLKFKYFLSKKLLVKDYNLLYVPGLRENGIVGQPMASLTEAVSIVNKVYKRNSLQINVRLFDLEQILSGMKEEIQQAFPGEEGVPESLITPIGWEEFQRRGGLSYENGAWYLNGERLEDMNLSDLPIIPDFDNYRFLPRIKDIEVLRETLTPFRTSKSGMIHEHLFGKPSETIKVAYLDILKEYVHSLNPSIDLQNSDTEQLERLLVSEFTSHFLSQGEDFLNNEEKYHRLLDRTKMTFINPFSLSVYYCNSIEDIEERKRIFSLVIDSIEKFFKIRQDRKLVRVGLPEEYSCFGDYQIDLWKYRGPIIGMISKQIQGANIFLFDRVTATLPIEPDNRIILEDTDNKIYTFLRPALSNIYSISSYPDMFNKPLVMAVIILHELAHDHKPRAYDAYGYDLGEKEDRLMMAPVHFHIHFSLRRLAPASIRFAYGIK
jgi:hypothetical protein